MRYGLSSVCSAALIGVALSAGGAMAQARPGWVDPPARMTQPEPLPPETVQGSSQGLAQGTDQDPSKPVPTRNEAAAPESPGSGGMAKRSEHAAPRMLGTEPAQDSARGPSRSASRMATRRSHRRLAQGPAIMPATPPPGASEARFPEWASAAQRLTGDYLATVSAPGDAMVATAPRFYAERVRFHGRTLSLAALIAEKRQFVRRWPERRYAPQSGSMHTACNAQTATCIVHTTFDFRAESPSRGARSQGVSELVLTVSFAGDRPLIVGEASRVLRRYGPGPLSAIAGTRRGA
ncbi:hypothetical protein G3T14_01255 [Methylobacterium sp. BTF04]|uniref:hypothetical protein n=1 Tax=Methylobacterium sp. BTF04 TaxID=2708300 RepID=UPI0013D0954C|nr:hypothetical protein [Methylobacterium sp. BTF04]NEU10758.1 hypothetical protein [Methylobacterium sp. BTF04]